MQLKESETVKALIVENEYVGYRNGQLIWHNKDHFLSYDRKNSSINYAHLSIKLILPKYHTHLITPFIVFSNRELTSTLAASILYKNRNEIIYKLSYKCAKKLNKTLRKCLDKEIVEIMKELKLSLINDYLAIQRLLPLIREIKDHPLICMLLIRYLKTNKYIDPNKILKSDAYEVALMLLRMDKVIYVNKLDKSITKSISPNKAKAIINNNGLKYVDWCMRHLDVISYLDINILRAIGKNFKFVNNYDSNYLSLFIKYLITIDDKKDIFNFLKCIDKLSEMSESRLQNCSFNLIETINVINNIKTITNKDPDVIELLSTLYESIYLFN